VPEFRKQKLGFCRHPGSGAQPTDSKRHAVDRARTNAEDIVGHRLSVFDVASDGSRFRISVVCPYGRRVSVSLPKSLRLVYPTPTDQAISRWSIAIVTLVTSDGFEVMKGFAMLPTRSSAGLSTSNYRRSIER
jgi:hypothetical protein